jgi:[acyl-carrier-protein] S-malonyltransferase
MAGASHKLKEALEDILILPPKIPVVSNVSAYSQDDPKQIKENLVDQLSSATHWEESIRNVSKRGIKTFLEIGPGTVLKGLLRRIDKELICHNIPA